VKLIKLSYKSGRQSKTYVLADGCARYAVKGDPRCPVAMTNDRFHLVNCVFSYNKQYRRMELVRTLLMKIEVGTYEALLDTGDKA
jgi:hypothetical protein